MISNIKTISLTGIEGSLVEVQTDITGGLPTFEIVGLPDTSVKESKERIKSAIKNSNVEFPSRRIIINLAPASTKKEGTSYDLPIAIGILIAQKEIINNKLENTIFIEEIKTMFNVHQDETILLKIAEEIIANKEKLLITVNMKEK